MKVEVKESSKKAERPFPKLMQHSDGDVYLFKISGVATILRSHNPEHLFGQPQSVLMTGFKDFEGSITLSND